MLLTFAETCERLRLSPETVYGLIKSGELKASKLGQARNSHYRIDEDDLVAYIRQQSTQAAS